MSLARTLSISSTGSIALGVALAMMSCTGSSFMKTPNLDRLAQDGALFRNLILATSVCCPSRAAFMTGTYNWVNGVFANAAGSGHAARVLTFVAN